jgi:hypothetical protein
MGQYDKAIADYASMLKTDPQNADALYGRGLAKSKAGDVTGGNADMDAARAINPKVADDFAD